MPATTEPPVAAADGRELRWKAHREQRRTDILDAAVKVIQAGPVGSELSLQAVADRAGIRRNVLYRYFSDKHELHRAVNVHIADQMWDTFWPTITLTGSTREITGRIIAAIVGWVGDNPNLYASIETEIGDGRRSEMQQRIGELSTVVVDFIRAGLELLGSEMSKADLRALDLIGFGITGQVRGTLQHWATDLSSDRGSVSKTALIHLMRDSIVFLLEGHARVLGLDFDADAPLPDLS
ncbi:MAG: TetR/AcrR family transcriptional regulator [Nocardioides sp.]